MNLIQCLPPNASQFVIRAWKYSRWHYFLITFFCGAGTFNVYTYIYIYVCLCLCWHSAFLNYCCGTTEDSYQPISNKWEQTVKSCVTHWTLVACTAKAHYSDVDSVFTFFLVNRLAEITCCRYIGVSLVFVILCDFDSDPKFQIQMVYVLCAMDRSHSINLCRQTHLCTAHIHTRHKMSEEKCEYRLTNKLKWMNLFKLFPVYWFSHCDKIQNMTS